MPSTWENAPRGVQFRLRDTVAPEFDNAYGRGSLGGDLWDHAGNWDDNAKRLAKLGVTVTKKPEEHAVALWQPRKNGSRTSLGHVAFVEAVSEDGNVIWVSEMNRSDAILCYLSVRKIIKGLLRLAQDLHSLRRTTQAPLHPPARFQQHKDPVSAGCYCDAERGEEPLAGFEELVDGFDGPGGGYYPGCGGGDVYCHMVPGGWHLHSSEAAAGERRPGADHGGGHHGELGVQHGEGDGWCGAAQHERSYRHGQLNDSEQPHCPPSNGVAATGPAPPRRARGATALAAPAAPSRTAAMR